MINEALIKKLKTALEKEKKQIEKELKSIAMKDKRADANWIAKYPNFSRIGDGGRPDEEIDEAEEYDARVSITEAMETQLRRIDKALKRISEGSYGICEKCGKQISEQRLHAYPAAELCAECSKYKKL